MSVFSIIFGIIVWGLIIGYFINNKLSREELNTIQPYGQMIEVNGKKMHVYAMGEGEETVVLLPGFGVPLPCADFGPLMRELSKKYKVICVEWFGMGFSSRTNAARTNQNYMEELREVLLKAGYQAPYILMPHSSSGIYCEYYAAKYPEEVKAVVMMDTTSTGKKMSGKPPKFLFTFAKIQQSCGVSRLANRFAKPMQEKEYGYAEQEIKDIRMFSNHVLNNTIIDQSRRMPDNANEVYELPFPEQVPVLKLIAAQEEKKAEKGYQETHLKRLGTGVQSKVLDSSHFLYQKNAKEICEEMDTFLAGFM